MIERIAIERKQPLLEGQKEIFLAGGCFWGTEEYLSRINGVLSTDVGYANGTTEHPTYEEVCSGTTGFVETVRTVYNPKGISMIKLLNVYFESIDPTAVNRQGNDIGDQYRTGIYYTDEEDRSTIEAEIDALQKRVSGTVAVEIKPVSCYYLAEEYHQEYLKKNPGGYCHIVSQFQNAKAF